MVCVFHKRALLPACPKPTARVDAVSAASMKKAIMSPLGSATTCKYALIKLFPHALQTPNNVHNTGQPHVCKTNALCAFTLTA
jgi:hypothetical protein